MKTKFIILGIISMFILFVPEKLKADNVSTDPVISGTVLSTANDKKGEILLARLEEINGIDKSALNSYERKQLKKEVRTINSIA